MFFGFLDPDGSNDGSFHMGYVHRDRGLYLTSCEPITETDSYVLSCCGSVDNGDELAQLLSLPKEIMGTGTAIKTADKTNPHLLGAVLERYGAEGFLSLVSGAFSCAIWHKESRRLTLGLDRLGIQALVHCRLGRQHLYASDLSLLCKHPAFKGEIDQAVLGLYFRHNYIPAPYTIYSGVKKLLPGAFLELSDDGRMKEGLYWNAAQRMAEVMENRFPGTFEDAVDELDELVTDATRRRLPEGRVGAFLSGGVDSSLMASMARKLVSGDVLTFAVGYDEADYNEAPYARLVAEHLGTIHHELSVNEDSALVVTRRLSSIYPEPFADSSQVPTTLVSAFAREECGFVLGGDGGDEIFGGYSKYGEIERLARFLAWPASLKFAAKLAAPILTSGLAGRDNAYRARSLVAILNCHSPEMILRHSSTRANPEQVLLQPEPPTAFTDPARYALSGDVKERLMFTDQCMYLPDDGVVKVRYAAAAAGLTTSSPLLDHRVLEFAWSLPVEYKIRNGKAKAVLKELLYRYVPRELIDRPKHGFTLPIALWLDRWEGFASDIWEQSAPRVTELFGRAYLERLRTYYTGIGVESRWGLLRLLDWLSLPR